MSKCCYVAQHWCGAAPDELARLKSLRTNRAIRSDRVGRISEDREHWLRQLRDDKRLQATVLSMPDLFQRASAALLPSWAQLEPAQQMAVLRLGVAAVQTAILLRALPARATNLRSLTFRGPDATLFVPTSSRKGGCIEIPGECVKNKQPLEADLDDAWPVVDWYSREIRPRLVAHHPYNKNAADSDFLFPGDRTDRPMHASTFAQSFAFGVQHAGIAMSMHQARHAVAFFVLSHDPNAIGIVAAWLGDDEATVRKYYSFLDVKRGGEAGRKIVMQQTKAAKPLLRRAA